MVTACANDHIRVAFIVPRLGLTVGGAIVKHEDFPIVGYIVDRQEARCIYHSGIFAIIAGSVVVAGVIRTMRFLVLTGGRVTHGLASYILHREPGAKQDREIDDPENDHHQDREGKGKLHCGLTCL